MRDFNEPPHTVGGRLVGCGERARLVVERHVRLPAGGQGGLIDGQRWKQVGGSVAVADRAVLGQAAFGVEVDVALRLVVALRFLPLVLEDAGPFLADQQAPAAGLGGAHDVDRPLERVVRGRLVAFRLFWLVGRTIDQFHAGLELVAGQLGGPRCGERARQHRRQDRAKTEHRGRSATTTNERRSRSHGLLLMCSAKETCPLPGWRRPHCGAADLGKSIKVVAAARKPVVWPDFMAGLVDDTNPTRQRGTIRRKA